MVSLHWQRICEIRISVIWQLLSSSPSLSSSIPIILKCVDPFHCVKRNFIINRRIINYYANFFFSVGMCKFLVFKFIVAKLNCLVNIINRRITNYRINFFCPVGMYKYPVFNNIVVRITSLVDIGHVHK